MNYSSLTLRDLEYLVSVADLGQFSKAAKACGVSQPGLSAQIKKVEEQLGIQIFDRTSKRVKTSPKGQLIVSQARKILDESKVLFELTQSNRGVLSTTLRLGSVATVGPYLIPHILNPLKVQYPDLELILKEGLGAYLLPELKNGNLDALLIPPFDDESLQMIPLFFEPFVVAFPNEHALLKKKTLVTKDLNPNDMVLLEEGHCLKDQALSLCPSRVLGVQKNYHATSIDTLKYLVGSGAGYTLLPKLATLDDLRFRKLLKYRRFSGKPVGRTISLVYRKKLNLERDMEALARMIRKSLLPFSQGPSSKIEICS